jgi:DNA polymerase sigma
MVSLSVPKFDRALAYDVFSILLVVFVFNKKNNNNFGEKLQDFFSLGLLDIAYLISQFVVH